MIDQADANPELARSWLDVLSNFGAPWLFFIAVLVCGIIFFRQVILPYCKMWVENSGIKAKSQANLMDSMAEVAKVIPQQNKAFNFLVKKANSSEESLVEIAESVSENSDKIDIVGKQLEQHIEECQLKSRQRDSVRPPIQ